MDTIDILNSDLKDFTSISKHYSKYLNDIHQNNFSFAESMNLLPLAEKFIRSVTVNNYIDKDVREEYLSKVENLSKSIKYYNKSSRHPSLLKLLIPYNKRFLSIVERHLEEVYSLTIKIIDETNEQIAYRYRRSTLNINDFFDIKTSSKSDIVILIEEAEEYISSENSFTEKTKQKLSEYLKEVKEDIQSENTNWSKSLGKIKEVIIFLAAASTLMINSSNIINAKNKLLETESVIQNTSINVNHRTINNTFILKATHPKIYYINKTLGFEYSEKEFSGEEE